MCYSVISDREQNEVEERFNARFIKNSNYKILFNANGFLYPKLPIIISEKPSIIQFYNWGLIPRWCKDKKKAEELRKSNLNAKAETIFEKPSFRESIINRRCLILISGFYEWHTASNNKKYPFLIKMKSNEMFALGGIYDNWLDKETDKIFNTFSVITTKSNNLLSRIHNIKRRMPLIIPKEKEKKWLELNDLEEINQFLKPYEEEDLLEAYPVSKIILSPNSNTPVSQRLFEYTELNWKNLIK